MLVPDQRVREGRGDGRCEPAEDRISITLRAKPGVELDAAEIEACLDYTVGKSAELADPATHPVPGVHPIGLDGRDHQPTGDRSGVDQLLGG